MVFNIQILKCEEHICLSLVLTAGMYIISHLHNLWICLLFLCQSARDISFTVQYFVHISNAVLLQQIAFLFTLSGHLTFPQSGGLGEGLGILEDILKRITWGIERVASGPTTPGRLWHSCRLYGRAAPQYRPNRGRVRRHSPPLIYTIIM